MPAVYDKMGIRFLYPDNWSLDEEEAVHGDQSVAVYSPSGAFWSIALHPLSVDPDELAAAALRTLKAEYPDCEAEVVREEIAGQPMRGYDLHFFYLDFINTALIRGFRTETATCLLLCQAEDRDYKEVGPVFLAMTTSLLAGR